MRWALALVGSIAATSATAGNVEVDSAVFVESHSAGETKLEPATRLSRGDRLVTIVRWNAPRSGSYTLTSEVAPALVLQSASHGEFEVSTDRGRTWRRVPNPESIPPGITHLRWQAGGSGRLTYRAIVR